MNRGQFDRLITVQRAAVTTNNYNEQVPDWDNPTTVGEVWARVRFGAAQEKREAAQEGGTQSATFEVVPTDALLAVILSDRIVFDGSNWDISEVAPLERNLMRFTATRSR